jgi:hypothetical protein
MNLDPSSLVAVDHLHQHPPRRTVEDRVGDQFARHQQQIVQSGLIGTRLAEKLPSMKRSIFVRGKGLLEKPLLGVVLGHSD